jgi:hypothetical protein
VANPTPDILSSGADTQKILKWLLGIGGMWIILTLMVDLEDTADLAVAIALVVMGSVLLQYGPNVFTNLGISTVAPSQSPTAKGV